MREKEIGCPVLKKKRKGGIRVMDAARRNVSVLLINHRVGSTCVHTHTLEKKKKKKGRMNYSSLRM